MDSWRVPDNNNLLLGKYKANTPVAAAGQICTVPTAVIAPTVSAQVPILPTYIAPSPVTTTVILTSTIIPGGPSTAVTTTTNIGTTSAPSTGTVSGNVSVSTSSIAIPSGSTSTVSGPAGNATTTDGVVTSVGTTTGIATTTIISTITVTGSAATTSVSGIVSTAGSTALPAPSGSTNASSSISNGPSSSAVPESTSVPSSNGTMPTAPSQFTDDVTVQCKRIFTVPCNAVIPPDNHIQACISDCHITGGYGLAESGRLSYMALCNTRTTYMSNDNLKANIQQAATVKLACGLGSNVCPGSCSNNGACSANGCVCNPGYSGLDCSSQLNNLIAFNSASNSFVAQQNSDANSTANGTAGNGTAPTSSLFPQNALSYINDPVNGTVAPGSTSPVFGTGTAAAPSGTRTPYAIAPNGASTHDWSASVFLLAIASLL